MAASCCAIWVVLDNGFEWALVCKVCDQGLWTTDLITRNERSCSVGYDSIYCDVCVSSCAVAPYQVQLYA